MFLGRNVSTELYQRAIDQFVIDAKFYFDEVQSYFLDLTSAERMLYLCAFILFLIYVIIARARRKYNPGSLGRQFAGAGLLLGVVLIGGNYLLGTGGGTYSGLFQL
jgi:hypothetical protein